jgi:hypothetical protein
VRVSKGNSEGARGRKSIQEKVPEELIKFREER